MSSQPAQGWSKFACRDTLLLFYNLRADTGLSEHLQ